MHKYINLFNHELTILCSPGRSIPSWEKYPIPKPANEISDLEKSTKLKSARGTI